MRKNLVGVISAVFCGILAMLIPLCIWHHVNFSYTPFTLFNIRKEAIESLEGYGMSLEDLSMAPFYVTLILSFLASLAAYVFSKRRA